MIRPAAALALASLMARALSSADGVALLTRPVSSRDISIDARGDSVRLNKRAEPETLHLGVSLENKVIFDGNSDLFGIIPAGEVGLPPVTVVCSKCCASGNITASFPDVEGIDDVFRIDMKGLSAYIELDVTAKGASTFSIPFFTAPTDLLSAVIEGFDVGLTFEIDLVLSLAGAIDVQGGFAVQFPEDAFFEASLLDGVLGNTSFDGIETQSLPFSASLNGTQKFQADLRMKAFAGLNATTDVFGVSAGVGAYVNLVEFIADLETTPRCQLQSSESANMNLGVFGGADVNIDGIAFGAVPTASTTLFSADIGTQCLVATGIPLTSSRTTAVVLPTSSCEVTPAPSSASSSGTGVVSTGGDVGTSSALLVLGSTTVMTLTKCASAIINCPTDLISTYEVTSTVCPSASAAATTAGVCFAANATNLVSMSSFVSTATQASAVPLSSGSVSSGLIAATVASFRTTNDPQPTGSASNGSLSSGSAAQSTRNGTMVITTSALSSPTPTSSSLASPSNPVITAGAGHGTLQQRWSLCTIALATVAVIFVCSL